MDCEWANHPIGSGNAFRITVEQLTTDVAVSHVVCEEHMAGFRGWWYSQEEHPTEQWRRQQSDALNDLVGP